MLSSLGVVVNKGNLGAIQDITDAAYAAVAGRTDTFVDLIPRLAELTSALNAQTNDILAAADGLDRFASILAQNKDSLGRTLDSLPQALKVLNNNRANIVDAFTALQRFGTVAAKMLSETKQDFAADLKDLYPVIKRSTTIEAMWFHPWTCCPRSRSPRSICGAPSAATISTCSSPST